MRVRLAAALVLLLCTGAATAGAPVAAAEAAGAQAATPKPMDATRPAGPSEQAIDAEIGGGCSCA
ncbi:MAG TPA: hypothetical protein VL118_08380, partial [Luteimonas sp.]|nr:hypothetical protein [Luteimonas sp.]